MFKLKTKKARSVQPRMPKILPSISPHLSPPWKMFLVAGPRAEPGRVPSMCLAALGAVTETEAVLRFQAIRSPVRASRIPVSGHALFVPRLNSTAAALQRLFLLFISFLCSSAGVIISAFVCRAARRRRRPRGPAQLHSAPPRGWDGRPLRPLLAAGAWSSGLHPAQSFWWQGLQLVYPWKCIIDGWLILQAVVPRTRLIPKYIPDGRKFHKEETTTIPAEDLFSDSEVPKSRRVPLSPFGGRLASPRVCIGNY